jgi:hypothetical protein
MIVAVLSFEHHDQINNKPVHNQAGAATLGWLLFSVLGENVVGPRTMLTLQPTGPMQQAGE